MNHADEIRPLVKMVRPHVAIITTIAAAHLGNFASLEEIAAAKAEIFEGLGAGRPCPAQSRQCPVPAARAGGEGGSASSISIPSAPSLPAEFRLIEYVAGAQGDVLWASIGGQTLEVPMGAPGRHIAENAVAVLGAAHLAGADIEKVMHALSTMQPEKGGDAATGCRSAMASSR